MRRLNDRGKSGAGVQDRSDICGAGTSRLSSGTHSAVPAKLDNCQLILRIMDWAWHARDGFVG
jgi:hypothetical protein